MEERTSAGGEPEYAEFVRNMRLAAERESAAARAAEWRGRSEAHHERVILELCEFGAIVQRSREVPFEKPPLIPGRFPWRSRKADEWRARYYGTA